MTNIYDLAHVNGDIYEIEADSYERDGEDWVFYGSGPGEVFRVCWLDVLSIAKSTLRPARNEQPASLWL